MKTMQLDSSLINKAPEKITTDSPSSTVKADNQKQNILNKIITKYKNLSTRDKLLATTFVCITTVAIGIGITYFLIISSGGLAELSLPSQISAEKNEQITFLSKIKFSMPEPPRDNPNPINGELYTAKKFSEIKNKYPIAVIIENHTDSRPQSGYNSADIVFETLVEGGITRTLAIFWGEDCPAMGPIRSARQYFLEWLIPFDPLFMFIGYATSDCGDMRVDAYANIINYGIKRLDTYGSFWRSSERVGPHNAYSSSEALYQKAEVAGYADTPNAIESWKFKKDASSNNRGAKTTANIQFTERLNNAGVYDVKWVYDRERNVYLKYNNNTPYTDANTDTQIYAKNIIIQRVEMISTFDFKAHIIITTIGNGDMIVLRDGQVINGTWEKKDLYSRTRYYDSEGKEIEFNRGNTWIEAVPMDQGTVQIEN